jgi:outer membrane immunogenic protein
MEGAMKAIFAGAAALFAIGMSGTAFAADMAVKAPRLAPPPPVYNWSGFYIGGHAGYGWQDVDSDVFDSNEVFLLSNSSKRKGGFGGGQIGFNWMWTPNWVVGVEADGSFANIKGSSSACTNTGCAHTDTKVDSLFSARLRLGYAINNVLLYGTGGFGWTESKSVRTVDCVVAGGGVCPGGPSPSALTGQISSASGGDGGWVAGAGVEYGFTPNITARIEYLHYQIDGITRRFTYPGFPTASRRIDTDTSMDTVRFAVNFLFGGGR